MTDKLEGAARTEALDQLKGAGWQHDSERDAIQKKFQFKNFVEAFGWMTQMAIIAEKLNHHPEWFNVYNTVNVTLTTHDANGLSALDVELAGWMDR